MEGYHRSVLLQEAVDALIPAIGGVNIRDAWYLDCTLGDGGHSIEIIAREGKIVGIDVDPQALKRVRQRFGDLGITEDKYKLILGNFRDVKNLMQSSFAKATEDEQMEPSLARCDLKGSTLFAGAIFDLGVSSLQLMSPERGFSFGKVGPLDMRMDPSLQVRALDLLKAFTRKELYALFRDLGEEKYSRYLADTVVRAREVVKATGDRLQGEVLKTTKDLANLVEDVYRRVGIRNSKIPFSKAQGRHPATKVFQALRMAVNDELGALQEGLDQVKDLIEEDGRIVVISFHSLEDRTVKNTFQQWQLMGAGEILTKKPIVPSEVEVEENPRSRSAKMRVFKKL